MPLTASSLFFPGNFENLTYVEYALDFVFLLDMIAAFNTAYYSAEDDAYVTIRRNIATNYLKSWFIVDLLSTVPFDLIVSSTTPAGSRWLPNPDLVSNRNPLI